MHIFAGLHTLRLEAPTCYLEKPIFTKCLVFIFTKQREVTFRIMGPDTSCNKSTNYALNIASWRGIPWIRRHEELLSLTLALQRYDIQDKHTAIISYQAGDRGMDHQRIIREALEWRFQNLIQTPWIYCSRRFMDHSSILAMFNRHNISPGILKSFKPH